MTLEELKEQNRLAEAAEQVAQPEEVDSEELHEEEDEVLEDGSAADTEETEDSDSEEIPIWMQSGDQTSQKGDKVPVKAHVAMKHKLKARVKEEESKVEELRQEIEKLKSGTVAAVNPNRQQSIPNSPAKRPTLKDYDYDEDKYNAATDDWLEAKMTEKLSSFQTKHQQTEQQNQQQRQMEKSVDEHYNRAAKLVEEGNLTADEYHDSDAMVRQRLNTVAGGNGDMITDHIISVLGEGSEKVIVALSRNPSYMMELERAFHADRSGSQALVYLGSLKSQFEGMNNRVSRTPRPARKIKGDASTTSGDKGAKKAYLAAHKKGDRQAAFDIKRKAKQDGINVREW